MLVSTTPISKWEQNPKYVHEIDGIEYIVDKSGIKRFHLDGSPVKDGGNWQCVHKAGDGYRCTRYAAGGTTVCQRHGAGSFRKGRPGRALAGKDPDKYKKMPTDLKERYERALKDPSLLSMMSEIALIQSRIEHVIGQLPDEEQLALDLNALFDGIHMIKSARSVGDADGVAEGLNVVIASVGTIAAERSMWNELMTMFERISKLKTKEIEHRKLTNTYVPAEILWMVVEKLIEIVQNNVPDSTTRAKIAADLQRDLKQYEKIGI